MTINNNNIFGAFTLNEARGSRLTGDWLNKESVANYGWFGGGQIGVPFATVSTIDRIDFSNDSVSASSRGPLSSARYYFGATGNSNYGWFGGGSFFPGTITYSTVDRIDFSNDSSTPSIRGPLTLRRTNIVATGNSNYGWFGGGNSSLIPAVYSVVDRIDFSNDSSTASVRGPLSSARYASAATGNSNYGWVGGGIKTAPVAYISAVDRTDFSNDFSIPLSRGPLSAEKSNSAATGNSNYGWWSAGLGFGGGAPITTVDRTDFSNDSSTALVRGPLSFKRYAHGATGNSNYGWFGGGYDSILLQSYSSIDRIDFSNDSVTASLRGGKLNAPAGRYFIAATSGVLNIRRQKAGNYGWFGGGQGSPLPPVATVDRINFSNDSVTASSRSPLVLSIARRELAATGNSNYGWFGAGYDGLTISTVDRIDFSNDSSSVSVRGPLSLGRRTLAATGNSNYGWFGGGSTTLPTSLSRSTVDRIDFSNDSSTASPRGSLNAPAGREILGATGNSNYGWFAGGSPGPNQSTVDRINFSNDSATALPRGPLSAATNSLAATGNSNYGWFCRGGFDGANRIDFSNDSATPLVRGTLSSTRTKVSATGNSNYGWFGGGYSPPSNRLSTVDRIDFSNDSVSASPRGPLSAGRYWPGATSNTNK